MGLQVSAGGDNVCRVGVMMDFFSATPEELAGMDLDFGPAGNEWPYVDCKGWILEVEEFAAEIGGRDRSEFGRDELLGDPADQEAEHWTVRVNPELAKTLAGLQAERIREYADEHLLEEWEVERLVGLAELARSAQVEGRDLYFWSSL